MRWSMAVASNNSYRAVQSPQSPAVNSPTYWRSDQRAAIFDQLSEAIANQWKLRVIVIGDISFQKPIHMGEQSFPQ